MTIFNSCMILKICDNCVVSNLYLLLYVHHIVHALTINISLNICTLS